MEKSVNWRWRHTAAASTASDGYSSAVYSVHITNVKNNYVKFQFHVIQIIRQIGLFLTKKSHSPGNFILVSKGTRQSKSQIKSSQHSVNNVLILLLFILWQSALIINVPDTRRWTPHLCPTRFQPRSGRDPCLARIRLVSLGRHSPIATHTVHIVGLLIRKQTKTKW